MPGGAILLALLAMAQPVPSSPDTEAVAGNLRRGVEQYQQHLPRRNGPATITAVRAAGTVVQMDMEIDQPLVPADWEALQPEFQTSLCAGRFRDAIAMGASAEILVRDTTGATRTYRVTRC